MKWKDAILLCLKELNKPVSAEEVYEHLKENKYRTFEFSDTPLNTISSRLGEWSRENNSGIKRVDIDDRPFLYYLKKNELNLNGKEENGEKQMLKITNQSSISKSVKEQQNFMLISEETENVNAVEVIDGVETEEEELQPFDPEKISIDTKPITMETCLRRLEQGTIILSPDFQRNEVWDIKQKSRLIESIMLKIPIPMFYVSSDEYGVYSVVDGLQRLSTIRSFILGDEYFQAKEKRYKGEGFKLKDLEFWGDKYNKRSFNSLPANMQNRILETVFTFTIINPGTPEDVKRNVFKRINTGGEPLKAQEIRHALYGGKSTELLKGLSTIEAFHNATDDSVKSKRMMDKELILRFLSFTIMDYINYPKNNDMDSFLCDSMRIINLMPELSRNDSKKLFPTEEDKNKILVKNTDKLKFLFETAMIRAKGLFQEHTFRKSYPGKNKSPINKSLFEVWSVLLSKLSENEYLVLLKNKQDFLMQYESILNDALFINSISRDSWKFVPGVKYRYEMLSKLLNKYSHD